MKIFKENWDSITIAVVLLTFFALLVYRGLENSDAKFKRYSEYAGGCKYVGKTNDTNGANAGGVNSVYLCANGVYYIR
jgi:hypothetical protein